MDSETEKCLCVYCRGEGKLDFDSVDVNELLTGIVYCQKQFHRHKKLNGLSTHMIKYLMKMTHSKSAYIAVNKIAGDGHIHKLSILSGSKLFHGINEDSWILNLEAAAEKSPPKSVTRFENDFARCYKNREHIIDNNYSEYYPNLKNIVFIPLFLKKQNIGQIALANRPEGYDDKLIHAIQPFTNTCIQIIAGFDHYKTLKRVQMEAQKKTEWVNISKMKDTFLSHISHETRTPLNGIIGMADLLSSTTELTETQSDYVHTIKQCGFQLLDLINDILDYSKMTAGYMNLNKDWFEIKDCVITAIETVSAMAFQKGLKIIHSISEDIPRLFGDSKRLRQVLLNILSNAVKFTDDGFIEITVRGEDQGDKYKLNIKIRDTGIGIAPKNTEHIFESFKQVDTLKTRMYGGTGLGLPITENLIKLMGGRIWVKSKLRLENHSIEEAGSTFSFYVLLDKQESVMPTIMERELSDSSTDSPHSDDSPKMPKRCCTLIECNCTSRNK